MSPDLLERWHEILPRLDAARAVCVLADFDGTLTPLVDDPALATLAPDLRRVVESLAANPKIVFGVVSGRALEVTPAGDIVWEYLNPHRAGDHDELIAVLWDVVRLGWDDVSFPAIDEVRARQTEGVDLGGLEKLTEPGKE